MADYLIFQVTAALGAMGELAGHERRGSLIWPGRSALIGLVGAAMGLRRDADFSDLEQMKTAIAIFDPGTALRDYHTIETIPSAVAKTPQSRPAGLRRAGRNSNTMITLRDYRTSPLFGVAIWDAALDQLKQALEKPVFVPYLGRKSCPLAAPLAPQIVVAETEAEALSQMKLPFWRKGAVAHMMVSDALHNTARQETRYDLAVDRRAWHFAPRQVHIVPVEIKPEVPE